MNNHFYVDPKIRKVRQLYEGVFGADFYSLPIKRQLELQADRLTEAHRHRDDAVCFQIASWHQALVGKPDEQILSYAFTIDDGMATIAKEYGYRDWNEVNSLDKSFSDQAFEKAVNTMLLGDLALLREQLRERPDLPRERSRYGHRATLLHYAGTNGVESYRQIVPLTVAEIVDFLIASGADPTARANMYGGSTPRELFESSKHSHESGVYSDVIAVFRNHGA